MEHTSRLEASGSGYIRVGADDVLKVKRVNGFRTNGVVQWGDAQEISLGAEKIKLTIDGNRNLALSLPPTVKVQIARADE